MKLKGLLGSKKELQLYEIQLRVLSSLLLFARDVVRQPETNAVLKHFAPKSTALCAEGLTAPSAVVAPNRILSRREHAHARVVRSTQS